MIPLVVVEGSRESFDRRVARLRTDGWEIREGFDIAGGVPSAARIACVGEVDSADASQAAVLAAVRGAAVVVFGTAPRDVLDVLCDDLRRLGPLEHHTGAEEPGPELDADQVALLRLLAGGVTLGEAAKRLHLSRRTADRRLRAAREALGAQATTEALMTARRLELL